MSRDRNMRCVVCVFHTVVLKSSRCLFVAVLRENLALIVRQIVINVSDRCLDIISEWLIAVPDGTERHGAINDIDDSSYKKAIIIINAGIYETDTTHWPQSMAGKCEIQHQQHFELKHIRNSHQNDKYLEVTYFSYCRFWVALASVCACVSVIEL